ncbi:TolC family protein [Pantoea sp.]|uniref:TolC family protein n=1 Tax=Pantoea sp. TaxID=69393 RepID=UPI0028A22EA2|nr:TolC family protein [Pantoea sp.]
MKFQLTYLNRLLVALGTLLPAASHAQNELMLFVELSGIANETVKSQTVNPQTENAQSQRFLTTTPQAQPQPTRQTQTQPTPQAQTPLEPTIQTQPTSPVQPTTPKRRAATIHFRPLNVADDSSGATPTAKTDQPATEPQPYVESWQDEVMVVNARIDAPATDNPSSAEWHERQKVGDAWATRAWLKKILREGLAYSTEVKGAHANFEAAQNDIDQIKGKRMPQLKLTSNSPLRQFGSGNVNTSQKNLSDSSLGVSVTTLITDFGKTSLATEGAQAASLASEQDVKISRNQITTSLILTLLDIQQYGEQLRISSEHKARMDKLVGMLAQIVRQDQGRRSELVQAQARELQALTSITKIKSNITDSHQKLIRLLGRDSDVPASLNWHSLFVSDKSLKNNIKNNPEILKEEYQYQSGLKNADAIKRDYLPAFNFVLAKNTAKDDGGRQDAWNAGINMEWNLYNGGSTSAAQRAAVNRALSSKINAEQTRRDMEYRFNLLYEQRDNSYANAKNFQALIKESNRIRQMYYEQWFYLNKRSLLDVLSAESEYLNAQLNAVNAMYDAYRSNINLINAANAFDKVIGLL